MANAKFAQSDAYLSQLIEEVRTIPDAPLTMGRRTFFKLAGNVAKRKPAKREKHETDVNRDNHSHSLHVKSSSFGCLLCSQMGGILPL